MVYKMRANDVRHYFFGIIIKKIAMPEYEYRYLELSLIHISEPTRP